MTFRHRLLVAFAAATLVPLTVLAIGVRRQLERRVTSQYRLRLASEATTAAQDLERTGNSIAARLSALAGALADDDRFRLGVLHGLSANRGWVLDYAARAMHLAGLSMLQVQDERGRIISSGHFRNEFDRLEPELPRLLAMAGPHPVIVRARAPDGPFLALARLDSLRIGGRRFTLIGGIAVDSSFLARFARAGGASAVLEGVDDVATDSASAAASGGRSVVARLPLLLAETDPASTDGGATLPDAALVLSQPVAELEALEHDVDHWFLGMVTIALLGSIGLAAWLSARLAGPLGALATATAAIDLEGGRLPLATVRARDDEIGALARRMEAMAVRLRTSATRLRDAERRATIGDLARQVNHDIRNGLIPIRNVLRHLAHVEAEDPARLPAIYAERRETLDAGVGWLETLARNYARLAPRVARGTIDVNAVARAAVEAASDGVGDVVRLRLAEPPPRLTGDPVAFRRILDNLVRNALQSLVGGRGRVVVETLAMPDGIHLLVTDTGRGMSDAERRHAFDDFFTTRADGTGLGLSVVRRLTTDLGGAVRIDSTPGHGTCVRVVLPCGHVTPTMVAPTVPARIFR